MSKPSILSYIAKKKFFKLFRLWFLCIPINFIPVFLKSLSLHEGNTNYTLCAVFSSFFHDIDYCFVFVSALFVLYIEAEYSGNIYPIFSKFCKHSTLIAFGLLLIDYLLMYFLPSFKSVTYDRYNTIYNITLAIVTLFFSLLVHLALSIKKKGA